MSAVTVRVLCSEVPTDRRDRHDNIISAPTEFDTISEIHIGRHPRVVNTYQFVIMATAAPIFLAALELISDG
jgi:D-lyxose ketol-isomerase